MPWASCSPSSTSKSGRDASEFRLVPAPAAPARAPADRGMDAGRPGTVDVVAVYEHLARLSDLRRAVGQGFKAVQRMAALPELSTLSHGAPTLPAAESDGGRSVESAE